MSGERPSSFLRLPDGTTWPNPNDPSEVAWRLLYGDASEVKHIAPSFMRAYAELVAMPKRQRDQRIAQIRRAAASPVTAEANNAEETKPC